MDRITLTLGTENPASVLETITTLTLHGLAENSFQILASFRFMNACRNVELSDFPTRLSGPCRIHSHDHSLIVKENRVM